MDFHRATAEMADILSEVLLDSRAHWNYSEAYAKASEPLLRLKPEFIRAEEVYYLRDAAQVIGFYSFENHGKDIELNNFWIRSGEIGKGWGRVMWEHALAVARSQGWQKFFILPDPGALGFYLAMGAKDSGEIVRSRLEGGPDFHRLWMPLDYSSK